MASSAGAHALASLDAILAQEPAADQDMLSKCTARLSIFRDALIAAYRPGQPDAAQRRRLEHVNAVISIVMAGHFPLGPVPWGELRKAREWLSAALPEAA